MIAAENLGMLSLNSVAVTNGGTTFGISGLLIHRLAERDVTHHVPFVFANITKQSQVDSIIAAKHLSLGDFKVIVAG